MLLPPRQDCAHTSCYCEENVWKLMEYVQQHDPDRLQDYSAIFISNAAKTVPLWYQRAGHSPDQPVVWVSIVSQLSWEIRQKKFAS